MIRRVSWTSVVTCLSILTVCILCPGFARAQTAQETQPEQKTSDSAPPIPRQPGDDVTEELKDPVTRPDAKQTEAQAAYMAGVAAQKKGEFAEALAAYERASKADPTAAEPVRARALLEMRLGKLRQAVDTARRAVEMDAADYNTRLQLAILLSASGQENLAEAVRLVEEALESKQLDHKSLDFIRIHSLRGRLYLAAQQAGSAAESYTVLLDALEKPEEYGLDFREHQALMNDRATGYETIGKVMLEIGRYDDAIRAFSGIARVNDNRPGDYHYLLALAQYRKDDLKVAEENLNRYFESNRRSRESLRLLSDVYNTTSRTDEVSSRLTELAANSSDADNVNLFLGDLLIERGKGDEAAKVYQSVITNSGTADAYVGLIRVDILKNDAKSLLETVNKALRARIQRVELEPLIAYITNDPEFGKSLVNTAVEAQQDESFEKNPSATYFYSQIAEEMELLEQEGQLLEATLQQNPAPGLGANALSQLGLNQYMQDKYTEAAAIYRRLLSMPGLDGGERLMTLYRLYAAEAENGNFESALTAIQTAVSERPRNAQLNYQMGLIQLQAKKFEEAEKTLKTTATLAESDVRLGSQSRFLLGNLYSQIGRWDDAIAAYQEMLAMPEIEDETIRRGRMSLSNAYVQKGDLPGGEKILEEVYKDSPDDPGINNDLGYLYADQNKNLEKAESMVRIAVSAEPDNPAYLDSLGWVLYRRGKFEDALEPLLKATGDPDYRDSTILEHLGDVQKALKKDTEAAASWKEALTVESESPSPNSEFIERLKKKLATADTVSAKKSTDKAEDAKAEDDKADADSATDQPEQ